MAAVLVSTGCGDPDGAGSKASSESPESSVSVDEAPSDVGTDTAKATESGNALADLVGNMAEDGPGPSSAVNSAEALEALVEEIHGPTADLSRDMNRLTRFPAVPTPAGAHVQSLSTSSANLFGDDRTVHNFTVELVVDMRSELVQSLFEAELTAAGWTKTGTEYNVDSFIDEEHERRTFTRASENDEEETISVTSIVDVQTGLNLDYRVTVIDEALRTRFAEWPAAIAPTPEGADFDSAGVRTVYAPGETSLFLSAGFRYRDAADSFVAGLREEVALLAIAGPYPVTSASEFGFNLTVEGYEAVTVSVIEDTVSLTGYRSFATPVPGTAIDDGGAPTGESSTDPIPAYASADQFAALLSETHRPTEDVSTQMRRLGPFPDVPTPLGANIVSLDMRVDLAPPEPGMVSVEGVVEFAVAGAFGEIDTFYRAQMAADGWILKSSDLITDDSASERVRHSYAAGDDVDSAGPRLVVDIADEPAHANVHVTLEYDEIVPVSAVDIEPWLGWEGNAPIPEGGQLVGVGVSSRTREGNLGTLISIYNFPGTDEEAILVAVEAASLGSDYAYEPNPNRTPLDWLRFSHPSFSDVTAATRTGPSGVDLSLEADLPFTR